MSAFLHPDSMAVRRSLEQALPADYWAVLTEGEVAAMTELIQSRCRKVATATIEEIAAVAAPFGKAS